MVFLAVRWGLLCRILLYCNGFGGLFGSGQRIDQADKVAAAICGAGYKRVRA